MTLYSVAVWSIVNVAGHVIDCRTNRSEVRVVGIFIFAMDQIVRPILGPFLNGVASKIWNPDPDQDPVDDAED